MKLYTNTSSVPQESRLGARQTSPNRLYHHILVVCLLAAALAGCGDVGDAAEIAQDSTSVPAISQGGYPTLNRASPSPSPTATASPYYPPTTPTRVSTSSSGVSSNGDSQLPSLSYDGSKLAFRSSANNLAVGAGAPSPLGGYSESDAGISKRFDVFVKNLATGQLVWASRQAGSSTVSDRESTYPILSGDGNLVVFRSWSSLIPSLYSPPSTLRKAHIYSRNLVTSAVALVDTTGSGTLGSEYSALHSFGSNRYVSFSSHSVFDVTDTNGRGDIFRKDLATGALTRLTDSSPTSWGSRLSWLDSTGTKLSSILSGSYNGNPTTALNYQNLTTGTTQTLRTSVYAGMNFECAGPILRGTRLFYTSQNLNYSMPLELFNLDVTTGQATYIAYNVDPSFAVSENGRYVVFSTSDSMSIADTNAGGRDIYIKDTQTGALAMVSTPQADRNHRNPTISGDGTTVAWVYRDTSVQVGRKDEIYVRKNPFL